MAHPTRRRSALGLLLGGAFTGAFAGAPGAAAKSTPAWQALTLSSPPQSISVQSMRRTWPAQFQAEAQLFASRIANGFLTLTGAIEQLLPGGLNLTLRDGGMRLAASGEVQLVLMRGTTAEGNVITVGVTPVPSEDCLIYTTIGTQVRAAWMAEGHITLQH